MNNSLRYFFDNFTVVNAIWFFLGKFWGAGLIVLIYEIGSR